MILVSLLDTHDIPRGVKKFDNSEEKRHVFFIGSVIFHAALIHVVNADRRNPNEKLRAYVYDSLGYYTIQKAYDLLCLAFQIDDRSRIEIVIGQSPKQIEGSCVPSTLMNFCYLVKNLTGDLDPTKIQYEIKGNDLYDFFYKFIHNHI